MKQILEVKDLSVTLNRSIILKDIEFSISSGEVVGLVGPNGSGKTTIMKAILALVPYSQGTVNIYGKQITPKSHRILEKVGALIENPGIYPYMTGYEQLKLFSTLPDNSEIDKLIHLFSMEPYIYRKAKTYSLGMKQKLGIILSLINKPDLVILDEPMNGLDPQAMKELRDIIYELSTNGTAFLISSHLLNELEKISHKLIMIDEGEVVQTFSSSQIQDYSSNYVIISTTDNNESMRLLKENNFIFTSTKETNIKINDIEDLSGVVLLLSDHLINITDIQQEDNNLEQYFLKLINKGEKK